MNTWLDCGDSKSYLHKPDGEVLAEILSGGYDRWSIKVLHRARGFWIGRDLAKAACESIVAKERPMPPGSIIVQQVCPPEPSFWQRLRKFKWWPDEAGNWT